MRPCKRCGKCRQEEEFPVTKNGYKYSYCKPCCREYQVEYRLKNSSVLREKRPANSDKLIRDQAWRLKNKEKNRKTQSEYKKRNAAKVAASVKDRKARKMHAVPPWAKKKYIEIWYEMARLEGVRTGRAVHVDHIVPLTSKIVCGLHCEDNMQLLFAEDNVAKSNKFWPDMP